MFWFISPWEAARRFLEAQRHLMVLPWIFAASGQRYHPGPAGKFSFAARKATAK